MTARIEGLLDLPDDDFRRLVEDNVGREAPAALWNLLLHPEVVRRTHGVLAARYRDIEDQLAQEKSRMEVVRQESHAMGPDGRAHWFKQKAEHNDWRVRALSYRRRVSERMAATKQALADAPVPSPATARRRVRQLDTVFQLAQAIDQHRRQCLGAGVVPDDFEVALWRSLECIEVETSDGLISVREFLDNVTSKPGFRPDRLVGSSERSALKEGE